MVLICKVTLSVRRGKGGGGGGGGKDLSFREKVSVTISVLEKVIVG